MKKNLFIFLFFLLSGGAAISQEIFSKLPLQLPNVIEVVAFPIGDSLFFSFKNSADERKCFWINPDGSIDGFLLMVKNIIGVTRMNDSTFFYSLEGKKDVLIQPILFTGNSKKATPTEPVRINSELLGVCRADQDLFLVLYEPKTSIFELVQLRNGKILSEKKFQTTNWS